jgi:hypothetical protein
MLNDGYVLDRYALPSTNSPVAEKMRGRLKLHRHLSKARLGC